MDDSKPGWDWNYRLIMPIVDVADPLVLQAIYLAVE